ncbi:hypothetical protein [Stomatobaculum longum]|uniref:hypothetical protein n=1 Tax=Stomatobaculum longum TaxID=796942 RepID=UPI0028048235|nr:hypothetical protein [Stomatobaculum longum]
MKKFHVKHLISFNGHITTSVIAETQELRDSAKRICDGISIVGSLHQLLHLSARAQNQASNAYDWFHVKHLILVDNPHAKKYFRTRAETYPHLKAKMID